MRYFCRCSVIVILLLTSCGKEVTDKKYTKYTSCLLANEPYKELVHECVMATLEDGDESNIVDITEYCRGLIEGQLCPSN